MDVLEFSKLYSDVHSPISLSIKFKPLAEPCEPGVHEDENTVNSTEKPRKWNDSPNNISVISWTVLLVEEIGENHRPIASH